MKVLVVEDDVELADILGYALRREGYAVVTAIDGQQALARAEAESPDIILLDGGLPKVDGFEVCRRLRQKSRVPIILLTARTMEEDVVRGLYLGADDYVVKPFSPKQLIARMAAVLRRSQTDPLRRAVGQVRVGSLALDRESHATWKNGQSIRLTRLEFAILYMLVVNQGHTIPYSRLVEYAWGYYEGGSSGLLKAHVSNLRRKLGLEEDPSISIEAIHGVGYRLVADEPSAARPRAEPTVHVAA